MPRGLRDAIHLAEHQDPRLPCQGSASMFTRGSSYRERGQAMCNAHNHPDGCTCGFGGEGHLGRRTGSSVSSYFFDIPLIRPAYASYVNPNARCPVCGDVVFFYQSPDGGRVFFDELGPPWPKHPCTDRGSVPARVGSSAKVPLEHSPSWKREGWDPFIVSRVTHRKRFIYEIKGEWRRCPTVLFLDKRYNKVDISAKKFSRDAIALVRKTHFGLSEVSSLSQFGAPESFLAYSRTQDAPEAKIVSKLQKHHVDIEGEKLLQPGSRHSLGTVKWFDAEKGYGFITSDELSSDVFVHSSVLRRSGVQSLYEGQRLLVGIRDGRKGPEARTVRVL